MKIKWNWGTGIFLVIILFFASMGLRIYMSYKQDPELITDDYYPKGLKYQNTIDKIKNWEKIGDKIQINQNQEGLVIQFPSYFKNKKPEGEIWLYRPSNGKLDKFYPLSLDSQLIQTIPARDLVKGKYYLKFDFNCDDKSYYYEEEFFIR